MRLEGQRAMADKLQAVDYSLYLVTDSGLLSPSAKSFEDHVEQLIRGGVTVVQLREKTLSTAQFVQRAKRLLEITRRHGIPLIVNDRVDVALAIDADGVHVGQDDMDLLTVRRLVGKDKIIGVSVNNKDEAKKAARDGADYLGRIGAIFDTPTKSLTTPPCGIKGLREILHVASLQSKPLSTVAIGGLNADNAARVRFQSAPFSSGSQLDGIAVVSALMGTPNPHEAAKHLKAVFLEQPAFSFKQDWKPGKTLGISNIENDVSRILQLVQSETPLVHHLTNNVVKNFSANVTLAIGASPIMSEAPLDFPPLANLPSPHSCVVNLGTLTDDIFEAYRSVFREYNRTGWPIVLDPVGAGATEFRARAVAHCLEWGYSDLIKGNLGEIMAVAQWKGGMSRGVDSIDTGSLDDRCKLARHLAQRERNIVVVTGKEDIISDGTNTIIISNGNPLLGKITGSGCSLGSVIGACLAVERSNKLLAALTGILLYSIASEYAAEKAEVAGPGSFIPAFLDTLNHLTAGESSWIKRGKLTLWTEP